MKIEFTLCLIKPDSVKNRYIGSIIKRLEKYGFNIIGMKMLQLSRLEAEEFYEEHRNKPFFKELINFMISGPVVAQVIKGENVILNVRKIIGHTDPKNAFPGTLRSDYAESCTKNAIHSSDSISSAIREIVFFFNRNEIIASNYEIKSIFNKKLK